MPDPSWLSQKNGPINHYNEKIHLGTQPVRVIHHMLIVMFQQTNEGFFNDILEQIKKGKLHRELRIVFGEAPIKINEKKARTPRLNWSTKEIELHETFLSYLWCCIYSIYVTYLETIDYPRCNRYVGHTKYPVRQEKIDEAQKIFEYAKFLIPHFEQWNKGDLPNPEQYLAEDRNYVEQTNLFYTEAVKFILCHEFTHLKLHAEKITEETENSHYLEYELEADQKALEEIRKGINYSEDDLSSAHRLAVEAGVVMGILSMLFFRAFTDGVKHPNVEDRLTIALEFLELDDNHFAWEIACVGLKFWEEQFQLNFTWDKEQTQGKKQYYHIVEQIKLNNQKSSNFICE